MTTTVNLLFGSRVMDKETGVILNDEMDDFATPGIPDAFGLRRECLPSGAVDLPQGILTRVFVCSSVTLQLSGRRQTSLVVDCTSHHGPPILPLPPRPSWRLPRPWRIRRLEDLWVGRSSYAQPGLGLRYRELDRATQDPPSAFARLRECSWLLLWSLRGVDLDLY